MLIRVMKADMLHIGMLQHCMKATKNETNGKMYLKKDAFSRFLRCFGVFLKLARDLQLYWQQLKLSTGIIKKLRKGE